MKKWLKNFKKDQRGLTLVELLAVVVILAIVAAIAFVLIGNVIENSRKDAHISNAQQVIAAAKLAEANGEIELDSTHKNVKGIATISKIVDPWDKEEYETVTVAKNGKEYSVTLKLKNTNSDKCNITNVSETKLAQGRDEVCKSNNG